MNKNSKYWLVYRWRAHWRACGPYRRVGDARQAARLMPCRDAYVVPCGVMDSLQRRWRASAGRREQ
jgi:hypothetical protein